VRVNAVCPGNIESDKLFSELPAEAVASRVLSRSRAAGLPEHAALSYLFALSNPHLTGQILVVDGGGSLGEN
jgi:NAD(P)-dependent dehydrogenase (short-subunit alcohol dehydrogenase family)